MSGGYGMAYGVKRSITGLAPKLIVLSEPSTEAEDPTKTPIWFSIWTWNDCPLSSGGR